MGKILAIYTETVFKEYILPSVNNSDYSITLDKKIFSLEQDLVLKLEVLEQQWRFIPDAAYDVSKHGDSKTTTLENGDIINISIDGKEKISIIVKEVTRIISAYEKFSIKEHKKLTLGMSQDNLIQYSFHNFVSQKHAYFEKVNDKWIIRNTSVNGIYVNSVRIQESYQLQFGDYINIMGLHIVFLNYILAIDTTNATVSIKRDILKKWDTMQLISQNNLEVEKSGRKLFRRAPRSISKIETEPILIEAPPAPEKNEDMSLMMMVGPSLTMAFPMVLSCLMMIVSAKSSGTNSGIYMYSGLIMAVFSSGIAVFWTLANHNSHKKKIKEKEIHRFEAYSSYLLKKTEELKKKYEHNMQALKKRYISAEDCVNYDSETKELWNRNTYHTDFLNHRLGLGELPFQAPIKVPEERFSLLEDSLTDKPRFVYENYKTLFDVPITVDLLKNKLIGVVGGDGKAGAIEIARLLSAQIAANNCYTEVKLAYAYENAASDDYGQWDFARWFPHVWSEDHKVRYAASNQEERSDLFYGLTKFFRKREELSENKKEEILYKPHIVLFVSNPKFLESELLTKYIFDEKVNYGLTTILLVERKEELPNSCRLIIENTEAFCGMYDVMQGEEERLAIQFDTVDKDSLNRFARRLSNIEVQEVEEGGEIPNSLSFLDMYHVNTLEELHVLERWKKNRTYDNIKGLIGQKAGGTECYLDVHEKYHGPHGLVAGTTGSGKSETLQTYMLSLAINYSPDDIGYFIIDYKGGGMANLFTGLPHLIGQISNLSGNQVHRAMVSIKSENRRRQQIFNENGVNNINAYTKLYKNGEAKVPVPHLFIIIDEFAELKREEPDFMRELISVAQVGRSLGVHLILATQKPSGTVDDNIWSNSKFRLCLRVQDKQDSNDMLHKPDAAYITQAGRCYLQVGNDEVFELFQSGFSGAVYIQDEGTEKTDFAKIVAATGKVEISGRHAKRKQQKKILYKWISAMKNILLLSLQEENVSSETGIADEEVKKRLIDRIYVHLEKNNIEYQRSAYNEKCLRDFIAVFFQAKQLSGDLVNNIIKIAKQASVKLPQEKEKTQLDAIKEYLAQIAEKNGYQHNLQLWLPVLPQYLYLESFEEYTNSCFDGTNWPFSPKEWKISVLMGKVDDPQNQAQMPLHVEISEMGHFAVCGTVSSGKSTFLQTFIYSLITTYSPQYVNIYGLDFSSKMMSAFEKAPHVGGIMYESDIEKIAKFFTMLDGILQERKRIFHGGNYSQYVKVNGVTLPALFVVIDNVSAFIEKTEERYVEFLIQLSKEGVNHGIYLILGGAGFGTNEIPYRVAENVMNVIALQQTEKYAYGDLLRSMQFDFMPESGIKGRGLAYHGTRILEFQTALSLEAEDDYKRMEMLTDKCVEMRNAWKGKCARPIPEIPEKPVWSEFAELEETKSLLALPEYVPAGYDAENASVYAINLRYNYCYLITGEKRTGKKNYLRCLIESALLKKADICLIDTADKQLQTLEGREGIRYVNTDEEIFKYFTELIPVFKERNREKHEMLAKDYDDGEIFENMKNKKPYFIFISDLPWFISTIQQSEHQMEGFLNNILEKGRLHHIYFFAILNLEDRNEVSGIKLFDLFVSDGRGIHFGGKVDDNPLFDFEYLSYKEQTMAEKPGVGMIPSGLSSYGEPEKIIVPLAKGKKVRQID